LNVEVLVLKSVQGIEITPVVEIEREPPNRPALRIDFGRWLPVADALKIPTVRLEMDVIQVVKPTRDVFVSPVWSRTVEVMIVFAISLIQAHSVFFSEVADNGEEVAKFWNSACNLDAGFRELRTESVGFSDEGLGFVPFVF
jgi:hypothetical protein